MCEDEVKIVQWTHEDGAKKGSPILRYGGVFGDVFIKHVLASMIKKRCFNLRKSRPTSSGMCKAKVLS
jgi:hypothetical protein